MIEAPAPTLVSGRWVQRFRRLIEPTFLFAGVALSVLCIIWTGTFLLIGQEHAAAEHAALASSTELAETYEAQVVRAMREIDQTLKLVQFSHERGGAPAPLQDLKSRGLLPPDLLFAISVTDREGRIVESTRAVDPNAMIEASFLAPLRHDALVIDQPQPGAAPGAWTLRFGRRLANREGGDDGAVVLSVDADYFVSGYEVEKLGEHGLLAVLGSDGVYRVSRTGESVSAGGTADYASLVSAADSPAPATIAPKPMADGVERYLSARELYEFPVAVVVGLAEDERLAEANRNAKRYEQRTGAASLLVILVTAMLGRLSSQLAQSRRAAVADSIEHAKRVEHLAYHDGLTQLPNRSLFSKTLAESIHVAQADGQNLAVMFLDLDRFKHINDTLGHEAGDDLLKEIAVRLKACVRHSDTVARLGGDEFVVLLPNLSDNLHAAAVAQKILSATARPFTLAGQEFRVTASIGVACFPQDGLDEQSLTKNADVAMYHAKSRGKNNFQFFAEELNASTLERLTVESSLRRALEQNEFVLHYQPKRDMRTGRISGMEALLRWQHPDIGTIAPMQFIPVAEETGLIVPIGHWVLRAACRQNTSWQKQGLPHLSIAINLTARQFFDEGLLANLAAILAETGMQPALLELEIAESLLMRDVPKGLAMLQALKSLGVRIAIDDFGTGYSSLSTLRQFPLDAIKIDRSFIRDVTSAPEDKALTEAIIAMGRTLSMTVVAQGVETKEQADFLRENACDEFQGFYSNKPVPADELAELLRTQPAPDSRQNAMSNSLERV